jgi:hypothetical protein
LIVLCLFRLLEFFVADSGKSVGGEESESCDCCDASDDSPESSSCCGATSSQFVESGTQIETVGNKMMKMIIQDPFDI